MYYLAVSQRTPHVADRTSRDWRWAVAAWGDLLFVILAAAWVHAEITGGARWEIGPLTLSNRSSSRAMIDMFVVLGIRHCVVWQPNVLQRVLGWFSAFDRTGPGTRLGRTVFSAPYTAAVVCALVVTRLLVFGVGWYATVTAEPSGDQSRDRSLARSQEAPLEYLHGRWDASWYASIAVAGGYAWNPKANEPQNVAFFPAFPLAVRWTTHVLDRIAAAAGTPTLLGRELGVRAEAVGVILSLVLLGVGLVLLARLAALDLGTAGGNAAVIIAATWPFSVFFSAPYTESMFFCAILGAFYCQRQRRLPAALLFGIVAGLTKQTGWLLAAPLAVAAWQRSRVHTVAGYQRWTEGLVVIGPVIGASIYFAYLWWAFDDPFAWLHAQKGWAESQRWLHLAAAGPFNFPRLYPIEAANLLAVVVAIPLIWSSRRIQWSYAVFGLVTVVVPIIVGVLPLGRLTAVAFPIYLALAANVRSASLLLVYGFVSLTLQLVVAYQFYGWRPLY